MWPPLTRCHRHLSALVVLVFAIANVLIFSSSPFVASNSHFDDEGVPHLSCNVGGMENHRHRHMTVSFTFSDDGNNGDDESSSGDHLPHPRASTSWLLKTLGLSDETSRATTHNDNSSIIIALFKLAADSKTADKSSGSTSTSSSSGSEKVVIAAPVLKDSASDAKNNKRLVLDLLSGGTHHNHLETLCTSLSSVLGLHDNDNHGHHAAGNTDDQHRTIFRNNAVPVTFYRRAGCCDEKSATTVTTTTTWNWQLLGSAMIDVVVVVASTPETAKKAQRTPPQRSASQQQQHIHYHKHPSTLLKKNRGDSERATTSSSESSSSPSSSSISHPPFASYMLYDVWHAYASTAVREQQPSTTNNGTMMTSVEDVIRSNGKLLLQHIYRDGGAQAKSFFYQSSPKLGPYCLYRKRQNESTGILPDCPDIPFIAQQHAKMLNTLGVDVVVVDGTNLGTYDNFSDALQLRPMEVLAEEWYKLRTEKNQSTPQMVAWNTLPAGSNLWQHYLTNIYNDARLSQLVARDPKSGKMIFMIPNGDSAVIQQVESNGGRNNVVVLQMWALWSEEKFIQEGAWQFMAPCRDGTQNKKYTTSVADLTSCDQLVIPRSVLGSSTTVSPSYQVAYSSLPFQAAGKLDTFTLRLQFASALNNAVVKKNAENVVLATFNEWIAQPQPDPYQKQFNNNGKAFSMGLPNDPWRFRLWVDTYGGALSRGIEPSVEFGSAIFDTTASCMRVGLLMNIMMMAAAEKKSNATAKLLSMEAWCQQHVQLSAASGEGGGKEFFVEPCCSGWMDAASAGTTTAAPPQQTRRNVWSLQKKTSVQKLQDFILVINPAELNELLATGQWTEICNPYPGPTAFCVDTQVLAKDVAMSGPFLLATSSSSLLTSSSSSSSSLPVGGGVGDGAATSSIGLWRCREGALHHFFSNDPKCEGATTEFFLGYSATNRSSDFPRALYRCYDPSTGAHVHSLDLPCAIGHEEQHYGYVH